MKNKLIHNIGLKIMAVLFSIALWMIAVDINNPVEPKVFSNVPVQLVNTSSITSQNKTYKVLDNSDTVRVTIRAPKTVLSTITKEDITAKADVSKLSYTNTVQIEVVLDKYLDKNVENISLDRDSVQLEIEEKKTKQLSIEVVENGSLSSGYVTGRIATESNTMSVSGPQSAVEPVVRAVVEVTLDGVTSNIDMMAQIRLLDADGNEVNSSDIKKSIDSVKVTVPILRTRDVPVVCETTGVPADGYALTGSVTVSPDTVRIAGKESVLKNVTQIVIPEAEVDINGAQDDVEVMVDIRKYLPADVSLGDSTFSGYVTVNVGVEPIMRKTINITESNIQILNIPDGWLAEVAPQQQLQLSITGLQRDLDALNEAAVVPHTDLSTLQDEEGNYPTGETEVELKFLLPDKVKQDSPVRALVRLTNKNEE